MRRNKDLHMQTDLHEFLARLAGTVMLALIPVLLVVLVCMPSSLHHHLGGTSAATYAPAGHMT